MYSVIPKRECLQSKEQQMNTTNTSQKKKKYCGQQIFTRDGFPSSGINSTDSSNSISNYIVH